MKCLTPFVLAGWILCVVATSTFAQDNLDQKIADQQKVAEEAKGRQVAGEPAVVAARTKAKELATPSPP
jgi:hypothetical protein